MFKIVREEVSEKTESVLGNKSIDDVAKMYNDLLAKGWSKEEIIEELKRLASDDNE